MKKKKEDLKQAQRNLQKVIEARYVSGEENAGLFMFIIFLVSLGLVIGGGLSENIYSIISGSILLIFIYFALK